MSSLTPPSPPLTIKQSPVEYDQQINNLLFNIEYNAAQAKSLCFVVDSLGAITSSAKTQIFNLKTSITNMLTTYASVLTNYAVYDGINNKKFGIWRPYYVSLNTIGMLEIVGDLDLTKLIDLTEATSSDDDIINAFNTVLEYCGDNIRGA